MREFFSNELGQSLEWFGSTHLLLTLGFIMSVVILWKFLPKIHHSKFEKWVRYALIALVIVLEWNVFESRMLTTSPFRMPLCAVALYSLTYAVLYKKKNVFVIGYFYAFGSLLSFLFFDTPWGLDRWNGWTFFGAHAMIAWLAVYGVRVLGFIPSKNDFIRSSIYLVIFAFISGYATLRFGGSDELFLFTPPVDFLVALQEIHIVLYLLVFSLFIALLMGAMYLPFVFHQRKRKQSTL